MLAVNVVHADDGTWIELQSSQRPDLIAQAANILGGKAEFWQGPPESRWGWYADTSWPGLPDTACAPLDAGKASVSPTLPAASSRATEAKQQIAKKTATRKSDVPNKGTTKPNTKKAATRKLSPKKTIPKKAPVKKSNKSKR